MKRLGLVILIALVSTAVWAQLKVDVALVNVVATVTDDKGLYVPDLTAEDFVLEEDGQSQTISHLTQATDLPVSVGVTLDTSGSMERKIGTATGAIERFIRTIHEDDDVFFMTFSDRPVLRQDFTSDRNRLSSALRKVSVGGGTALYDALDESLRKVKDGEHEKRAILLITDGVDTSSFVSFDQAALSVRESEILVYCVGISPSNTPLTERGQSNPYPGGQDPNRPGGGNSRRMPTGRPGGGMGIPIPLPGGGTFPFPIPGRRPYEEFQQRRGPVNPDAIDMDVLNAFADASGGKAWLLSGTWTDGRGNQVEKILDEIANELRSQYNIGYYPTHPLQDGKWHRITIRAKNPKYLVRARKEYFGK